MDQTIHYKRVVACDYNNNYVSHSAGAVLLARQRALAVLLSQATAPGRLQSQGQVWLQASPTST
eukprot:scaffold86075_cov19-Prasinocladus_malaysianus.AAC.1